MGGRFEKRNQKATLKTRRRTVFFRIINSKSHFLCEAQRQIVETTFSCTKLDRRKSVGEHLLFVLEIASSFVGSAAINF